MSQVNLSSVLQPAYELGYAVAGFVVLGWEDARAYVEAAEAENAPVILQAGPNCRKHTPLPILATMFTYLAENSSVPVVTHLDHAFSPEECRQAIDLGFTSVMYDGSDLPFIENLANTVRIVEQAQKFNVSVEAELGIVGYAEGKQSQNTDPQQAQQFVDQTNIDALAISIGNVHLQTESNADIDLEALGQIETVTNVPLVLHGGSGINPQMRKQLAQESNICKFNFGTELRMVFGQSLRNVIDSQPNSFDRIELLKSTETPIRKVAQNIISTIMPR